MGYDLVSFLIALIVCLLALFKSNSDWTILDFKYHILKQLEVNNAKIRFQKMVNY
jgi:hypothetical protein